MSAGFALGCNAANPAFVNNDATAQSADVPWQPETNQRRRNPPTDGDTSSVDTDEAGSNLFGVVSPPCSSLASAALTDAPSFVLNTFEFDGTAFDPGELSEDGSLLFETPGAGGSSKCSEVFSLELWQTCAGATLHETETQVAYATAGAMTDYTVKIQGEVIGVSVTRAYMGPNNLNYTAADAETLLAKKLKGINESSTNVAPKSAWKKQVLHVWTLHEDWGEIVQASWSQLDSELQANTTVVVTVESGSDFVVTDTCDD